jgi:hypothetical protein
LRLDWGRL